MLCSDDVAESSIRIYLSPEKKLRFKTACVAQDRDMSDVVNELIDKWLEENDPLSEKKTGSRKRGKGVKKDDESE